MLETASLAVLGAYGVGAMNRAPQCSGGIYRLNSPGPVSKESFTKTDCGSRNHVFFNIDFYFMCIGILPACVYLCHMYVMPSEKVREGYLTL